MYNLFAAMHEKKCLYTKKSRGGEIIVVAREIRLPGRGSKFFLIFFVKPLSSRYIINMQANKRVPRTLRVGGELMLRLLNDISLDTLEQVYEDLGPTDFTNIDLVRTVELILESRKRDKLLEEGDTVSIEAEWEA